MWITNWKPPFLAKPPKIRLGPWVEENIYSSVGYVPIEKYYSTSKHRGGYRRTEIGLMDTQSHGGVKESCTTTAESTHLTGWSEVHMNKTLMISSCQT